MWSLDLANNDNITRTELPDPVGFLKHYEVVEVNLI